MEKAAPYIAIALTAVGMLIAGAIAYGQQSEKIENLEEAIQAQTAIRADISTQAQQNARIDERTKALVESQKRTEQMLQILIQRIAP